MRGVMGRKKPVGKKKNRTGAKKISRKDFPSPFSEGENSKGGSLSQENRSRSKPTSQEWEKIP